MRKNTINQSLDFAEGDSLSEFIVIDYRVLFEKRKNFLFFYDFIPTELSPQFLKFIYKNYFNNPIIILIPKRKSKIFESIGQILLKNLNYYLYEIEIDEQKIVDRYLYLISPKVYYTISGIKSSYRSVVFVDKFFTFE